MKRLKRILEYLMGSEYVGPLIMAPGAPPVCKNEQGVQVALEFVMSAEDIVDSLIYLKRLSPMADMSSLSTLTDVSSPHLRSDPEWASEANGLADSEIFSFGILRVGRFRVSSLTQRGSKIVSIARVPFGVPALDTICSDPEAEEVRDLVTAGKRAVIAVWGPSSISSSVFVYSLLKEVNDSARRVIFILERSLTFLLNHDSSIVIQSELNTDVPSFERGLLNASPFSPDLIYIGDVWPSDEITSLCSMTRAGATTILSSASLTGAQILRKFRSEPGERSEESRAVTEMSVEILPAGGEKVSVCLH
ncbi:hypothetical protein ACFLSJ_07350 [Verrucomicrobiota bacterium]